MNIINFPKKKVVDIYLCNCGCRDFLLLRDVKRVMCNKCNNTFSIDLIYMAHDHLSFRKYITKDMVKNLFWMTVGGAFGAPALLFISSILK